VFFNKKVQLEPEKKEEEEVAWIMEVGCPSPLLCSNADTEREPCLELTLLFPSQSVHAGGKETRAMKFQCVEYQSVQTVL